MSHILGMGWVWILENRGFVPPCEDDQLSFALTWGWDHEKDCCQPSGWAHGIGDQSEDHRRPVHPLGVVWADGRLCLKYRRVGRREILSCRLWVVGGCFFVPKLMSWSTLLGGVKTINIINQHRSASISSFHRSSMDPQKRCQFMPLNLCTPEAVGLATQSRSSNRVRDAVPLSIDR